MLLPGQFGKGGHGVGLLRRIATAVTAKPAVEGRRTLLVEDNPDEARAMAQALERAGFPVECASSVSEAMASVEGGGKYLAAIVDMNLPDASGGLVVWQLRRRHLTDVPIAVVTGMPDPHVDYNLSRYPPDCLFPKPLDVDRLLAWLRTIQQGSGGGLQNGEPSDQGPDCGRP